WLQRHGRRAFCTRSCSSVLPSLVGGGPAVLAGAVMPQRVAGDGERHALMGDVAEVAAGVLVERVEQSGAGQFGAAGGVGLGHGQSSLGWSVWRAKLAATFSTSAAAANIASPSPFIASA